MICEEKLKKSNQFIQLGPTLPSQAQLIFLSVDCTSTGLMEQRIVYELPTPRVLLAFNKSGFALHSHNATSHQLCKQT